MQRAQAQEFSRVLSGGRDDESWLDDREQDEPSRATAGDTDGVSSHVTRPARPEFLADVARVRVA